MEEQIIKTLSQLIVRRRKALLFLLGLLLGFCGFLLAHEKEIPWVSQPIYRKVHALESGFHKVCGMPVKMQWVGNRYRKPIIGDLSLVPHDEGFRELSNFILKDLKRKESEYFARTWSSEMSFDDFKSKALENGFSRMEYQGIPGNRQGINVPISNNRIKAFLNKSTDEWASFFVYKMINGIEREYRSRTLAWSSSLYFLGLFIQVFQFDWRRHRKKQKSSS